MSYIGQRPVVGRYIKLDQISSGFNGSETSFSMTAGSQAVFPGTARNLLLSLGGVIQEPDTNFTISGSTLTFTTAPVANTTFFAVIFGDMQSTGTPSDGTVLPASIASSGNFSFPQLTVTGTSSLGDDVTFTGANYNAVWDKSDNALEFADNAKLRLGTGNDLQIYHDGTNSLISDTGNGYLKIDSNGSGIYLNKSDGESMASFITDGAVELFHNGTKKFETTTNGGSLTGDWNVSNDFFWFDNGEAVFGSGGDLKIYHDGTDSIIKDTRDSGTLRIHADSIAFNDKDVSETMLLATADGSVNLYYNGSKKFETDTNGITVTGRVLASGTSNIGFAGLDNVKLSLGTSDDLKIHHDGSNSYIDNNTGALNIRSLGSGANVQIIADNDYMARFVNDGAVELYYDNAKKFETTSTGANVTSANDAVLKVTTTGTASTDDARIELITQESSFIIQNDRSLGTDGALTIGDGTDTYLQATKDAEIGLYFNNNKKFETTSTGATVTGTLAATNTNITTQMFMPDQGQIRLGNSDDLKLYHDGSESVIGNSTGTLQFLSPNEIRYRATTHHFLSYGNDETMAKFIDDGAVELYFDNTKRIFTESAGGAISGKSRFLGHGQGSGANSTEVHFNSDNSHIGIHFSGHGNTGNTYTAARMVINGTGGTYGTITYSLGGTGYNSQSSDSRSKKNIVEWTESELDKFKKFTTKIISF